MGVAFLDPRVAAIGRRVTAIREAKGMTLEQLASVSGLSAFYLGLMESGKYEVTIHSLFRLADALEVEPAALLTCDPKKGV